MGDIERSILQELETIVENETGYLKETKENFTDCFKFYKIKELLEKRRSRFDYKITQMLMRYGYTNFNIREKMDKIWDKIDAYQPEIQRYIRPLRWIPLVQWVVMATDDTSLIKLQTWTEYTSKITKLIKDEI